MKGNLSEIALLLFYSAVLTMGFFIILTNTEIYLSLIWIGLIGWYTNLTLKSFRDLGAEQ